MKWEDRHEGVFKFLKSEAVAQMWGQKKKNTSMTYEKLSRAMRLVHVSDQKCVNTCTDNKNEHKNIKQSLNLVKRRNVFIK